MSARVTGQQKDGEILANIKGAFAFYVQTEDTVDFSLLWDDDE